MKNLLMLQSAILIFWVATLLPAPLAQADRVSLTEIDAKLDRLLAGPFNAANHVTLTATSNVVSTCTRDMAYHRINLDGTQDSDEFIVPADNVLFLTDISFGARDTPTDLFPGRVLRMQLRAQDVNGANVRVVYWSPKIDITSSNADSRLGANEVLAAGVAIGPGRIVCAEVSNASQLGTAFNTVRESVLRGFLVPSD